MCEELKDLPVTIGVDPLWLFVQAGGAKEHMYGWVDECIYKTMLALAGCCVV